MITWSHDIIIISWSSILYIELSNFHKPIFIIHIHHSAQNLLNNCIENTSGMCIRHKNDRSLLLLYIYIYIYMFLCSFFMCVWTGVFGNCSDILTTNQTLKETWNTQKGINQIYYWLFKYYYIINMNLYTYLNAYCTLIYNIYTLYTIWVLMWLLYIYIYIYIYYCVYIIREGDTTYL